MPISSTTSGNIGRALRTGREAEVGQCTGRGKGQGQGRSCDKAEAEAEADTGSNRDRSSRGQKRGTWTETGGNGV